MHKYIRTFFGAFAKYQALQKEITTDSIITGWTFLHLESLKLRQLSETVEKLPKSYKFKWLDIKVSFNSKGQDFFC